jgi:hypothetical protein
MKEVEPQELEKGNIYRFLYDTVHAVGECVFDMHYDFVFMFDHKWDISTRPQKQYGEPVNKYEFMVKLIADFSNEYTKAMAISEIRMTGGFRLDQCEVDAKFYKLDGNDLTYYSKLYKMIYL